MKYVSIDVGLKRIGVAFSPDGKFVFPSEPILRKNRNQASRDLLAVLNEKAADVLVVGLPKGGSSQEEMERRIKHFVSLIEFDEEIVYQDEYGSSQEAEEMAQGIFRNKRDGKTDSLAAKVILERYLKVI
ncbi:MAG: Holliday junction resolvase RuvX [Campylobacterales bacterium]|nr:Holliday junction resolvase RuvX [Campylobacterales bacterium]